jgi:hypothetical protein
MTRSLARVPLILLALGACTKAPTAAWQPVRVIVENFLTGPVTIVSGGTTYGTFSSRTTPLSLPPNAATLTWTPAAPLFSDSIPVPSDLTSQTVALASGYDTVTITNVVNGQTYVSPLLVNLSGDTVDVAVVNGGALRFCAQLASANFQLAYYLLTTTVEVRAYPKRTNCAGTTFTSWNHTSLASYQANSGLVQVNITAVP